jgi:hypothetical protein
MNSNFNFFGNVCTWLSFFESYSIVSQRKIKFSVDNYSITVDRYTLAVLLSMAHEIRL